MSYCSRCGKWNGAVAGLAGIKPTWCVCPKDLGPTVDILGQQVELLTKELEKVKETEQRLLIKLAEAAQEHIKERTILQATVDKWHEEYLNASKDAMNFASKLNQLEAQGKTLDETLENAWQRVSYGKVDFTAEDFKNSMMFDYPQYSWNELHNLIKGIKK